MPLGIHQTKERVLSTGRGQGLPAVILSHYAFRRWELHHAVNVCRKERRASGQALPQAARSLRLSQGPHCVPRTLLPHVIFPAVLCKVPSGLVLSSLLVKISDGVKEGKKEPSVEPIKPLSIISPHNLLYLIAGQ